MRHVKTIDSFYGFVKDNAWQDVLEAWHYWLHRRHWLSLRERIENGDCDE